MRRLRITLAIAILAGSLVMYTTGAANAATYLYGSTATWQITNGSSTVGGVSCSGNVRWRTTVETGTPHIVGKVKCKAVGATGEARGGDFDAGSHVSLSFTGDRSGLGGGVQGPGPVCAFGGQWDLLGTDPTATLVIDALNADGCEITEVCQSSKLADGTWGDVTYSQECTGLDLGAIPTEAPEPPTPTCSQGVMGEPWYTVSGNYGEWRVRMTPAVGYSTSSTWVPYVVYANGNRGGNATTTAGGVAYPGAAAPVRTVADLIGTGGAAATWHLVLSAPKADIVGFGVYRLAGQTPSGILGTPAQAGAEGRVGITDLNKCSFYWGAKVADVPDSEIDDPITALPGTVAPPPDDTPTEPEDDTDEGCDFSFLNPTTWLEGGMCSLVGLIRDLINAVKDLPGKIASAFRGVFLTLLVPDDAPSFSDIPSPLPTGWLPDFPDLGDGTCGTVTLPAVDLGAMLGNVGPTQLFDTCDDPWPFVRTITYNGTLALVYITLMFAAWRGIATALGIDVDRGSGGDDE